jgi:hypothetical protein
MIQARSSNPRQLTRISTIRDLYFIEMIAVLIQGFSTLQLQISIELD